MSAGTAWTARCAAAEAIGMTAAAAAGTAAQHLVGGDPPDVRRWAALGLIVAGGLVEGIALATLQVGGLRSVLPVTGRRRWIAGTVAVAGLGWSLGGAPTAFATSGTSSGATSGGPPVLLVGLGAAGLGAVLGAALGAVQATALRAGMSHPRRWVVANLLAWPPAMVIIFGGAAVPGDRTPVVATLAIGCLTGALAGTVLGVVTGLFLPHAPRGRRTQRGSPRRRRAEPTRR